MWAVMAFLLAAVIGLVAVLAMGRRGSTQDDRYPWILYDTAKLHVGITAGLAGFGLDEAVEFQLFRTAWWSPPPVSLSERYFQRLSL